MVQLAQTFKRRSCGTADCLNSMRQKFNGANCMVGEKEQLDIKDSDNRLQRLGKNASHKWKPGEYMEISVWFTRNQKLRILYSSTKRQSKIILNEAKLML